ncbi:MAG: hypothetical protein IAA31_01760 [Candidatus Anaerobiospirillum merdipullorum]|uniref:DUF1036 domain-containing protein n=1 Tax=Candidatus Anaerobiospirillum merdipullorum TaxID=2838450 RepID=A0A9E2KMT3_9GAMM|nr:hypothetical protein [Candidatus Anaerobiospirillum merdipullorum]
MRQLIYGAVAALLMTSFMASAQATVRIDIKNDSTEDCSVALNARIDHTKWLTVGWYVYAAGEEAPIILDEVNDIRAVYLYHDCSLKVGENDETKRAWVKVNRKFSDTVPMDGQEGYEEVTFIRLQQSQYVIPSF